jgi:hypothetical protein
VDSSDDSLDLVGDTPVTLKLSPGRLNMLIVLPGDAKRMDELQDAVRDYLAWQSIAGTEKRIVELALSAQQGNQARKRLKDADQAVSLRITDTYHWVSVPVQPQPDRPSPGTCSAPRSVCGDGGSSSAIRELGQDCPGSHRILPLVSDMQPQHDVMKSGQARR